MNQFIESLVRLYKNKKIDKKKLNSLLSTKKISQSDYNYILKNADEDGVK